MDPRYMDNLEKNTFSLVLLQWKNCETRGAFLAYWRLTSLLSFEKELGLGERLVQHTIFGNYQLTLRFLWKNKVWSFGSGNDFKASICIMSSLYELWLGKVFDNSCWNLSLYFFNVPCESLIIKLLCQIGISFIFLILKLSFSN